MPDRSPRTDYREIIDALVGRTTSIAERLLREEGVYSRAPADEALNDFARSLTDEQRESLATICRAERVSAIHDALAELSWWIDVKGVSLAVDGVEMPVDESGMGLHGDFMGRLDDWPWPNG
jgi:hypothetical protein